MLLSGPLSMSASLPTEGPNSESEPHCRELIGYNPTSYTHTLAGAQMPGTGMGQAVETLMVYHYPYA